MSKVLHSHLHYWSQYPWTQVALPYKRHFRDLWRGACANANQDRECSDRPLRLIEKRRAPMQCWGRAHFSRDPVGSVRPKATWEREGIMRRILTSEQNKKSRLRRSPAWDDRKEVDGPWRRGTASFRVKARSTSPFLRAQWRRKWQETPSPGSPQLIHIGWDQVCAPWSIIESWSPMIIEREWAETKKNKKELGEHIKGGEWGNQYFY